MLPVALYTVHDARRGSASTPPPHPRQRRLPPQAGSGGCQEGRQAPILGGVPCCSVAGLAYHLTNSPLFVKAGGSAGSLFCSAPWVVTFQGSLNESPRVEALDQGHTHLSFGVLIGWCSHTAAERVVPVAAAPPPTVTSRCCPAHGVGLSEKYISVLAFNSNPSLF